jgi:membrane associated rhomboid family serine protease
MLLHGSTDHLWSNMVGLWSLGSALERRLKPSAYIGLYFFSGVASSLLCHLFDDYCPSLGASAAIYGILGSLALTCVQIAEGNPGDAEIQERIR